MTPTRYRDQVAELAKTDVAKAVKIAEKIPDPWFQAQAWAHLIRFADDPLRFSGNASKAASKGRDDFQRSAVRSWEIAALAERKYYMQARRSLREAIEVAIESTPISSRAEALFLLFQAACKISVKDAAKVAEAFEVSCSTPHWRVERARKNVASILNGDVPAREFFW